MSEFGSALKRLAGLHDLTSRETAQLLGVTEQTISDLIRGKHEPGQPTFVRTKRTFQVDPFEMYEGIEGILPSLCDVERFRTVEAYIEKRGVRKAGKA